MNVRFTALLTGISFALSIGAGIAAPAAAPTRARIFPIATTRIG